MSGGVAEAGDQPGPDPIYQSSLWDFVNSPAEGRRLAN